MPPPAAPVHSGWLSNSIGSARTVLTPDEEVPVGRVFAQSMLMDVKVPAAAHEALAGISRQHFVASFCPRSGTCRILVTASEGIVRIERCVYFCLP